MRTNPSIYRHTLDRQFSSEVLSCAMRKSVICLWKPHFFLYNDELIAIGTTSSKSFVWMTWKLMTSNCFDIDHGLLLDFLRAAKSCSICLFLNNRGCWKFFLDMLRGTTSFCGFVCHAEKFSIHKTHFSCHAPRINGDSFPIPHLQLILCILNTLD